jgi:hypothetical protein
LRGVYAVLSAVNRVLTLIATLTWQTLATVTAAAAAAASVAEAKLASAVAERREAETVKAALLTRLRKLETDAHRCFAQMEAMQQQQQQQQQQASQGPPHEAGAEAEVDQPPLTPLARSIDSALKLAMGARAKPHTPKRTNTHVRFEDEGDEGAYELHLSIAQDET